MRNVSKKTLYLYKKILIPNIKILYSYSFDVFNIYTIISV